MIGGDVAASYRRLVARCSGTVVAGFLPASRTRAGTVPVAVLAGSAAGQPDPQTTPACVLIVTPTTLESQRTRLKQEVTQLSWRREGRPPQDDTPAGDQRTVVLSTQDCFTALRDPDLARWCRHTAWEGHVPAGIGAPASIQLLRTLLGPASVLVGRTFLADLAGMAATVSRTAAAGSGTEGMARLAAALRVPAPEFGRTPPLSQYRMAHPTAWPRTPDMPPQTGPLRPGTGRRPRPEVPAPRRHSVARPT